jgi:predicted  nucleic acid-binding Zn-ribbon protein
MIRIYILLFIVTTVLTLGYGGYRYVTQLQQQVITLRENNLLLEQVVATNQATINRMAAEAARNAELQSQLQGRLQAAEQRVNSLRTRLSQIDITREALADPADMEARINRGVQRLIERILEDTGGEVVSDTSSPASAE